MPSVDSLSIIVPAGTIIDKLDKLHWECLALNPKAIHILEKNIYKLDWKYLSRNPNIFIYDYDAIKNHMYKEGGFVEKLMANRFHPKNMGMWNDWGFPTIHDEII